MANFTVGQVGPVTLSWNEYVALIDAWDGLNVAAGRLNYAQVTQISAAADKLEAERQAFSAIIMNIFNRRSAP